jgi:hypothetical protein
MMAIAETMNANTVEQPEYLDDLDEEIKSVVDHQGRIMLYNLARLFPEHQYQKIWTRSKKLAEWGFIRIGRARRNLICFSIEA